MYQNPKEVTLLSQNLRSPHLRLIFVNQILKTGQSMGPEHPQVMKSYLELTRLQLANLLWISQSLEIKSRPIDVSESERPPS